MNHWLQNSIRNLLPLSRSDDFQEALAEWFFTGGVEDYEWEDADVVCELCEHPDLAHHYQIKNSHTGSSLLVGSKCILKFQQIEIRDELGEAIVDSVLRRKALEAALRKRMLETSLDPLRKLWKVEKGRRNYIEGIASEIKRDGGLSPRRLLEIFSWFDVRNIAYSAKLYKVNLRGDEARLYMSTIPLHQFQLIAPALSSSQKEVVRKLRDGT